MIERARIGILISGRGSNMTALADAVNAGRVPHAEVALVISDQPDAAGLAKAAERGIETLVITRRGRARAEHDGELISALRERKVDLVCLAGYMRILSSEFIEAFRGRIPEYSSEPVAFVSGLDAQRQAISHGVKWTGCTVHFVDETLDGGPIIAQRAVPIRDGDTVETLSERILEQEHDLYPEAVALVINKDRAQT